MKLITIAISTPLTSLSIPALPKFLSEKVCVLEYKQIVLSKSIFDLCGCVTQFLGEMPFFVTCIHLTSNISQILYPGNLSLS